MGLEIKGDFNKITVRKTKKPLKAGEIVVRYGTRWRKATNKDKGPFAIVLSQIDKEHIKIANSGSSIFQL